MRTFYLFYQLKCMMKYAMREHMITDGFWLLITTKYRKEQQTKIRKVHNRIIPYNLLGMANPLLK